MIVPTRSIAALLIGAALAAQDQDMRTLEVHVTSVSGRDVYLDMGRTSGLAPGQIVKIFPPGVVELEVVVRSVSSTSARAEMPVGATPPPIGTRGEVSVPKAKPQAQTGPAVPQKKTQVQAPDHPPWQRQIDPRNPDEPLLVPTYGQKPDERPFTLDGRAFLSTNWNRDNGGDRSDDYLLSRVGLHAEGRNGLGQGERTLFAGEITDRRTMLADQPDRDELNGRIDLASVAFGTEGYAPLGAEFGRFLSQGLPEIGLIDGAEALLRFENGIRFGGGVGAYPLPFPGRASGDDIGAHAFFDYAADASRSFAATVGVQKTWHTGAPDRDLLLLRAELRPRQELWFYASAKVDYYTSGDTRKSPGIEFTETMLQARYDAARIGGGIGYTHFAWPDLLRAEYQLLPDDLVRNGHVDRVSLSGWVRPVQDLRLTGRADFWQDQDGSGTALELGADWTNFLKTDTLVSGQVFLTDGGFQSGPGFRLLARRRVGDVEFNAGYRWYGYEITGLLTGTESYTRQAIEAGASWALGDFDLDLMLERWFGTQEDAYAAGLYVQWRF